MFLFIGNEDQIVRLYWGQSSEQSIKGMGFKQYILKEYEGMAHASCTQVGNILSYVFLFPSLPQ